MQHQYNNTDLGSDNAEAHAAIDFGEGDSEDLWLLAWGRLPITTTTLRLTHCSQVLQNTSQHKYLIIHSHITIMQNLLLKIPYYILVIVNIHLIADKHTGCQMSM